MATTIINNTTSTVHVISAETQYGYHRYHGTLAAGDSIQQSDLHTDYDGFIGFSTTVPTYEDQNPPYGQVTASVGDVYYGSTGGIIYPMGYFACFSQLADQNYDIASGGSNTVLPAHDIQSPSVSSLSISSDGLTVAVTFDEGIYSTSSGSGAMSSNAADYTLHLSDSASGGNDAGDASISSVSHTEGSATITLTLSANPGEGNFAQQLDMPTYYDQYGNPGYSTYFYPEHGSSEFPAAGDSVAPTFSSALSLAADNSTVDVTFSEAVYSTNGGSGDLEAADFVLSISGGSATLASSTPSSISDQGSNVYRLGISLASAPSGAETLTVQPASSAIFDASGNAAVAQSSNHQVSMNDTLAPTISSVSVSADNSQLTVVFLEQPTSASNGSAADLEATDFSIAMTGGRASLSSATPSAISKTNATTYVLTLSGNKLAQASGAESVVVSPASSSIYDLAGNVATAAAAAVSLHPFSPASVAIADDNSTVSLTFGRAIFSDASSTSLVDANKSLFSLELSGGAMSFQAGSGAQAPSALAMSNSDKTVTLTLPTTSGTANGHEVIEVTINGDSTVFDSSGTSIDASEMRFNKIRVNQQLDPGVSSGFVGADDIRANSSHFSSTSGGGLELKDGGVSLAKMADLETGKILGNVSGSTAAPSAITLQTSGTLNNTAGQLADNAVIKAYVDAQLTAQDMDIASDGGAFHVDLSSGTLTIAGGTGLTTSHADSGDDATLTVTLDNTAVTAATYGSATAVPQFTVDAQGRLTDAANVSILHDSLTDHVANEHIDHSSVTLTAGAGLSGGGNITASRSFAVEASQTVISSLLNADLVAGRDAHNQIKFSTDNQIIFRVAEQDGVVMKAGGELEAVSLDISGDADIDGTLEADAITVAGTAVAVSGGAFHDGFSDFVANEHIDHSSVTLTAGSGLSGGGDITANRSFAVEASQTVIESLLNASLVAGRDADNQIKFSTDNQIIFRVDGGDGVIMKTNGELEATSLDISGNADIDGTLEADAITVNGTALADLIAAQNVDTATLASTVTVTDDSSNSAQPIVFHDGSNGLRDDEGALTYNPSTGALVATSLSLTTDLAVAHGGTGLSAAAKGSVLVANAADTLSALDGGGSASSVLFYTHTSDEVSWKGIDATSAGNVLVSAASIVDNDFLRIDGESVEGLSSAEVMEALSGASAAAFSMNSQKITSLAAPVDDADAATKAYVDNLIEGISAKTSVVAASTANVAISSLDATATLDGVSLALNDRVLLKDQTDSSENGIYKINAGGSAATRVEDMAAGSDAAGIFVFVEGGSTHPDQGFLCSSDKGSDVVGSDNLTFVQFSSAGVVEGGAGLVKSGTTLNVVGTADKITVSADAITIADSYAGQTSIVTLGTIATGTWQGTAIANAYVAALPTSKITTGTFADARIAESNVTQHQAAITGLGTITSGVWAATDVAVAHGGTGASDAATARTNLGVAIGTDVLAQQAIGIANDNLVEMDDADAASGDFARFTANGLEGRDASEVRSDLSLVPGTNVQAYHADLANLSGMQTGASAAVAALLATEIAILDGATLSTDELNLLDDMTRGSIIYGNPSGASARLAKGAENTVLSSDGTDISYTQVSNDMLAGSILASKMNGPIFADLEAVGAPSADGEFLVATGAGAFAYESGATVRNSLGLQPVIKYHACSSSDTTGIPSFALGDALGSDQGIIVFVNGAAKMRATSNEQLGAGMDDGDKFFIEEGDTSVELGEDCINSAQDHVIIWFLAK